MTAKEIEDYINTHRLYPPEYKGKRDKHILYLMNHGYKYDSKKNTITKLEGRINDNGDFELIGSFVFPVGRPEEKVPVEENKLDMNHIIDVYNGIMKDLGYEDRVIDKNTKWNLRDMVAEIDNVRAIYHTKGNDRYNLRYENEKLYENQRSRLHRFIRIYRNDIKDMVCTEVHNSRFDNKEVIHERV